MSQCGNERIPPLRSVLVGGQLFRINSENLPYAAVVILSEH